MTKKAELLAQIKELFKFSKVEDLKFLDVVLEEGKTIRVDGETLETGLEVSIVNDETATKVEDGSVDGTYQVEGKTIVITDNKIESAEEFEEETEEEETETETEIELADETETETEPTFDYQTEIATITNRVTVYEEQISELRTITEKFAKLFEDFISDTPADTTTKTKNFKTEGIIIKSDTKNALDSIKNIRNKK